MKVTWSGIIFHPSNYLNLRKDSCMNLFSVFWGLVSVCDCCGKRCGRYPLVTSLNGSTFLWKYCDSFWFFFLFSQQVDTVFSWNFHMWFFFYCSWEFLPKKFALNSNKPVDESPFIITNHDSRSVCNFIIYLITRHMSGQIIFTQFIHEVSVPIHRRSPRAEASVSGQNAWVACQYVWIKSDA